MDQVAEAEVSQPKLELITVLGLQQGSQNSQAGRLFKEDLLTVASKVDVSTFIKMKWGFGVLGFWGFV